MRYATAKGTSSRAALCCRWSAQPTHHATSPAPPGSISYEECETGYATDKGVECYERLKGRPGVALFDPQATGITFALTDKVLTDKIDLCYEEAGEGEPIVFVHEFGGDMRSWEPQMRYFSRRYRCICFNARGYPPSQVPE